MPLTIKCLSTTGGYLEKARIEFSPGLTCIIGARGTCKSTIVETIRFLFNCDTNNRIEEMLGESDSYGDADAPSHKGLLRETLQGATARCEIDWKTGNNTEVFTIERDVGTTEPRIYREGVKELADRSVLHCVEIFSQGELQHIAEDGKRRLELIDRPNKGKLEALKTKRAELASRLKELGSIIRNKRSGIESRRADIKALEAFRQQLAELQGKMPKLPSELEQERVQFTKRKALLDLASSVLAERGKILSLIEPLAERSPEFLEASDEFACLPDPEALELAHLLKDFAVFLDTVKTGIAPQVLDAEPLFRRLEEGLEMKNERYYQLRQSEQEINESLKTQDRIRAQINHLEKIQKEVTQWQLDLKKSEEERKRWRLAVSQHSDSIFKLRLEQVEQINKQFAQKVVLTLTQGTRSAEYRAKILLLLEGSRLRNREEIAQELSEKIPSAQLIDIVDASDSSRLAQVLDRDLGQMARLVSYLGDSPDLYDLETHVFDDELNITLYDEGVPKRVDQLSKGQKATAVLPLILRAADYPLIFDQPEDDLDNRFVYATLVETVRTLKTTRQVIFVTHNANIPVLGDAERILVMRMENPKKALPPEAGSVEEVKTHILSLLEGGAEAFKKRQEKYGALVD